MARYDGGMVASKAAGKKHRGLSGLLGTIVHGSITVADPLRTCGFA